MAAAVLATVRAVVLTVIRNFGPSASRAAHKATPAPEPDGKPLMISRDRFGFGQIYVAAGGKTGAKSFVLKKRKATGVTIAVGVGNL
jgi:hypothetical protein